MAGLILWSSTLRVIVVYSLFIADHGKMQKGIIFTLSGKPSKLVDKFLYLGSNISSSESDVNICLVKAWTAFDRLSITWKSDLSNKIKQDFSQAVAVSILIYGCTTWTLRKCMEKKLDGNYTRMLCVVLNKSWKQHPTKQQPYSHLPPIPLTTQVRQTRHAEHCWRSKDE